LPWALAEANADFDLALESWPGLEAQVAAIADDVAYDNHDIDDGLRAGLFTLDALLAEVPLAAGAWAAVKARYPDVPGARLVPELVRELIGRMVNDVLAETEARAAGLGSIDEVRAAGRQLAGFSAGMATRERALKRFLYAHMYDSAEVKGVRVEAQAILAALFAAYRDDPSLLPAEWRPASADPVAATRRIGDFIAGMTDRYAVRRYEDLFGPSSLRERF
jgi:dGTPase